MSYFTDILYLAATPFFLPPYLYKILIKKKYRQSTRGMLGMNLKPPPWHKDPSRKNLWLHAVSVGEVVAGKAILSEWLRAAPNTKVLASTVTETGQEKARQLLTEAEEISFYPLDFTPIVRRFLNHYKPDVYIMMETEIWPNFLGEASGRGVKIFLANGKLSDKSFLRWKRFKPFFPGTFESFTAIGAQTEQDKEKFSELLGSQDRILVTGNCKFDSPGAPLSPDEKEALFSKLGINKGDPVVVIGSTHPGEEEIMIHAFNMLREKVPSLRVILAPRHPERFDPVARLLTEKGIRFSRYSDPSQEKSDFILVDTIGVLARLYGLGRVAVVGGSFVPVGGHNLLEAAVHSIPVIFGPYMQKQPELLKIFGVSRGALQLKKEELAPALERLLANNQERQSRGSAAAKTALQNRGSAKRSVEFFRKFLK